MDEASDVAQQFERYLNSPKQTWLLGAGVSFMSNVPLMATLTERVLGQARTTTFSGDAVAKKVLDHIEADLVVGANIELILTHLGDLISLAERSRKTGTSVGGIAVQKAKLTEIHIELLRLISQTVRWGFRPAKKDQQGNVVEPEECGQSGKSITKIDAHSRFIRAVFGSGRAGLERHRGPVEFFTTNYDTLIEDALALEGINYSDWFGAGGVAAWQGPGAVTPNCRATISKLHGSIDWYRSAVAPSPLLRVRSDDTYPQRSGGAVMIYPQATKYLSSQLDPFASLFQRFRQRLLEGPDQVLLICGYSFSDDHVDAEIEAAMHKAGSKLTIVAFTAEPGKDLPKKLKAWRTLNTSWADQVYVASPKGLYRGSGGPYFGLSGGERDWWTFDGVSKLLAEGLPKDIADVIS